MKANLLNPLGLIILLKDSNKSIEANDYAVIKRVFLILDGYNDFLGRRKSLSLLACLIYDFQICQISNKYKY